MSNGRDAALIILGVGSLILFAPFLVAPPQPIASVPVDDGSGDNMNVPTAVNQWRALAEKYAQINYILAPEEILAVIWNESTGNPNAQNPGDPSWGLMGVTALIGTAYASITSPTQLFDPETNIKAGSGFMAYLKDKFSGQYPNTWIDAYNEGETKFAKGIDVAMGYGQAWNAHLVALVGGGQ